MEYKDQLQNVLMEIAIMKKLQHPNLVRLHEVVDDDDNGKLYMGNLPHLSCSIVMDYCELGELLVWNN